MTKKRTYPKATTASVRRAANEASILIAYATSSRRREAIRPRQITDAAGHITAVRLTMDFRYVSRAREMAETLAQVLAATFDVEKDYRDAADGDYALIVTTKTEKSPEAKPVGTPTADPGQDVAVHFLDDQPLDASQTPWITPATLTVDIPGAFLDWFEGTSAIQGESTDATVKALKTAYDDAALIKHGHHASLRLTTENPEVLRALAGYADTLVSLGTDGDFSRSEIEAARKVIVRCQAALVPSAA